MSSVSDLSAKRIAQRDPAKPLVVLQIVPAISYGGLERTTFDVSAALTRAGGRALIAAPETSAALRLRASGAELMACDLTRPRAARIMAKIVMDEDVDIIHARSRAGADVGLGVAQATGAALVTTWPRVYDDRRSTAALSSGRPVIAVSDFVARHLAEAHGVGEDRAVVIPRGVDMNAFSEDAVGPERAVRLAGLWGLAEDLRPVVLAAGRLTPENGVDVLAKAATRLKEDRGADFLCLLVGEGDADFISALERRIVSLGAGDVMRIIGPTPDMPAALKLSSVVVSSATTPKASARVIVEAAAMGRPVVAANHGAATDAVKDGETGFLVPPGDDAALAEALGRALAMDESARAHVANTGRAMVRSRFTVEAMQDAVLDVYRAVCAAGEVPASTPNWAGAGAGAEDRDA